MGWVIRRLPCFGCEGVKRHWIISSDYTVSHTAPVGGTQVVHKEVTTVVEDPGPPEYTAVPLAEDRIGATDRHTERVVHGGHLLLV